MRFGERLGITLGGETQFLTDSGGRCHNGLDPLVEFEHAIVKSCDVVPATLRREQSPRALLLGNLDESGGSIWIVVGRPRSRLTLKRSYVKLYEFFLGQVGHAVFSRSQHSKLAMSYSSVRGCGLGPAACVAAP